MNETDFVFSDLDEDDLLECAELFAESFKQPPWNEAWQIEDAFERLSDFFACPKTIAIKAIHKNKIAGFFIGNVEVWCADNYFYLKEMCVSHTQLRTGVGSSLMKNLENRLQEAGISRLYLMTERDSTPERFYTSLGYMVNHELIVMRKKLD